MVSFQMVFHRSHQPAPSRGPEYAKYKKLFTPGQPEAAEKLIEALEADPADQSDFLDGQQTRLNLLPARRSYSSFPSD
jgi:hypothetical protein